MNIAELVSQALTSGSDGLRAHFDKLPRKDGPEPGRVLPALVITQIAGTNDVHLRGESGLRRRLFQLDAWGGSRKFADDYMELARAKMMQAPTFSVGAIDVSGAPDYDVEANLYRASLEFSLWFNQ